MNEIGYIETVGRGGSDSFGSVCGMNGRNVRSTRVWLVDDNARFRALLASLLHDEGDFDCERQFSNPLEALEALAEGRAPDIILLDIEMGEYNGLEAVRPLKSAAKNTHVLMLTTFTALGARERAFRDGASDFMLKSWTPDEIAAHMRQAVEFGSVAGLMTTFLTGGGTVAERRSVPKSIVAPPPRESIAERWVAYLRGWLKLSPS